MSSRVVSMNQKAILLVMIGLVGLFVSMVYGWHLQYQQILKNERLREYVRELENGGTLQTPSNEERPIQKSIPYASETAAERAERRAGIIRSEPQKTEWWLNFFESVDRKEGTPLPEIYWTRNETARLAELPYPITPK